MGLLDTLFGRREQPAAVKAVTGSGAYWMENGTPLRAISREPTRLAAEAQRAYHTNEWVHAAENLIDSKFATVPWHLEDADGETVEENQAPTLFTLLRNPSLELSRSHLWRLTCRHLGLTGNAFWVLDEQDEFGIPRRVLYLNPARVTPATTPRGQLQGWIVDADRPDGRDPVPLTLDETIHFVLDPPDYGHFGIGKVEAAWRKIMLSNATSMYAEGSLKSGGRKSALIWPDGVTVENEQWDAWVNNLRSASEDGFGRRLTANKFPVGSMDIGQTSEQLKLPELSEMAKEDLLAIWGVPPSALGITESRGLNSGESAKYEEAALWQNAIEPRLATFAEQVQARLIDPFGYTLILETPEFDDDAPLYDIASKAVSTPLKVDERRALVGLDPLDEKVYGKLGQAILIAQTMVELSEKQEISDNLVPFAGRNNPPRDDDAAEMPAPGEVAGKGKLIFTDLRQRLAKQYTPRIDRDMQAALTAQRDAIKSVVIRKYDHLQRKPSDDDVWWNESREHQRIEQALVPTIEVLIQDSGRRLRSGFFASTKADNFIDRVASYVRIKVGERIRGINDTTRTAIRAVIADGVREGLSPAELGDRIEAATQFNESRAEMIARTETALAYNDTAIGTYRAFDVEEVQAIDGDQDDACAARNGQVFTLAEASGITDHPNGTLDWVPIVKAAAPMKAEVGVPQMTVPVTLTPEIHVPKPDPVNVNVPAPVVNVHTDSFVEAIADLKTMLAAPKRKTIKRDKDGRIIGLVEE